MMEAVSVPPRLIFTQPYTTTIGPPLLSAVEPYQYQYNNEIVQEKDQLQQQLSFPTPFSRKDEPYTYNTHQQRWPYHLQYHSRYRNNNLYKRQRPKSFKLKNSRRIKRRREPFSDLNESLEYNEIVDNNNNFPLTKNDIKTSKILSGLVATMGLSGLFLPVLALATIPLDLLNPNILLAKSLALLSIPVALLSYGKKKRRKRNTDSTENDLNLNDILLKIFNGIETQSRMISKHNFMTNNNRTNGKRGLMIINVPASSSPPPLEVPVPLKLKDEEITTIPTTTTTTTPIKMVDDKPNPIAIPPKKIGPEESPQQNTREQCFERIACEGLLKSLPQLFIGSLLRGKEQMFRSFSSSQFYINEGRGPTRFKTNKLSRRKNLAKYALSKINNNGNGNNPTFSKIIGGGTLVDTLYENSAISVPLPVQPLISMGAGLAERNPISTTSNNNNVKLGCHQYKCSVML